MVHDKIQSLERFQKQFPVKDSPSWKSLIGYHYKDCPAKSTTN